MAEERVAKFLSRRQKKQSRIVWKHYDQRTLYDKYGLYELKTWAGNLPEIIKIGKPYAGEPHVRFDERGWKLGCMLERISLLYRVQPVEVGIPAALADGNGYQHWSTDNAKLTCCCDLVLGPCNTGVG